MIGTMIIIGLAFIWLLYETDWLRVRLLVGEFVVTCQGSLSNIPCSNLASYTNRNGVRVCEYHKLLIDAFTWENRNDRSWGTLPKIEVKTEPITVAQWIGTFQRYRPLRKLDFTAPVIYPSIPLEHTGYAVYRTFEKHNSFPEIYAIYISPNTDTLVSREWLDSHWNDLKDYVPKVELCFGNGYKQSFTLKKIELMQQIVKINTAKRRVPDYRTKEHKRLDLYYARHK